MALFSLAPFYPDQLVLPSLHVSLHCGRPFSDFFPKQDIVGSLQRGVLGILARGGRNFRYFWEVGEVLDIVFRGGEASRCFCDVGTVCEVRGIFDIGVKWMRFWTLYEGLKFSMFLCIRVGFLGFVAGATGEFSICFSMFC